MVPPAASQVPQELHDAPASRPSAEAFKPPLGPRGAPWQSARPRHCASQWGSVTTSHLHVGAPWPMGRGDGAIFACGRASANGQRRGSTARRRTRAWPRQRREEPRARPPAPPGPRPPPVTRRLRRGGAGIRGAARPRFSFSTTSPWTGGPRACVPKARSPRRRRHRPPRPVSRRRRRPRLPPASRGYRPGPRPRACSAPRRRPPASAWTDSARGEWAGGRAGRGGDDQGGLGMAASDAGVWEPSSSRHGFGGDLGPSAQDTGR
jgi:hypothetical protein